ncbi:sensor histidine kinase [Terrisporobacter glycolicus]
MEIKICLLIVSLSINIFFAIRIYLLRKSAKEIKIGLVEKAEHETNTIIDISSHDNCMRELANSVNMQLEELYKQRQHFYQGDKELKDAITNISHDLRTPLTAIYAYLDLLKHEEKSDLINKYLSKIENRIVVLKNLTEELFHYTVTASNVEHISVESVIVNNLLEESIASYYAVIKNCNIIPDIVIPQKNVVCFLNRNAISRVFENILSNIVKYSDGDLHIILYEDGQIVFSNHASGLTETQVAKLFDRFYTVEDARKSTGLGLSIAKILMEQMNGKIVAQYTNGILSICIQLPDVFP